MQDVKFEDCHTDWFYEPLMHPAGSVSQNISADPGNLPCSDALALLLRRHTNKRLNELAFQQLLSN